MAETHRGYKRKCMQMRADKGNKYFKDDKRSKADIKSHAQLHHYYYPQKIHTLNDNACTIVVIYSYGNSCISLRWQTHVRFTRLEEEVILHRILQLAVRVNNSDLK